MDASEDVCADGLLLAVVQRERHGAGDDAAGVEAGQFGGFSQTMLEVGLRYADLHLAIQDGNRDYARYQAEKIGDAIERGAVRRAGREASSRALFLDGPLPALMEAIDSGEDERIRTSSPT